MVILPPDTFPVAEIVVFEDILLPVIFPVIITSSGRPIVTLPGALTTTVVSFATLSNVIVFPRGITSVFVPSEIEMSEPLSCVST